MFGWSISITIIFFSFLGVIYSSDPVTLSNSLITTEEEAEKALAVIEPGEVLPLVLFEVPVAKNADEGLLAWELRVPQGITEAVTVDRKMAKGTKFTNPSSPQPPIFFCPSENPNDACLAPTEFGDGQRLKCDTEPMPIVRKLPFPGQCGPQDIRYCVFYEICPSEKPYSYETEQMILYDFCYNENKRKTTYTDHLILSPKILSTKLLYREQNVSYPFFPVDDEFKPANYETILYELYLEAKKMQSITSKNTMYEVVKLIPSEEMPPFALWRKSVYQFFNAESQHKKLRSLWNSINGFILEEAARIYDEKRIEFSVKTGVSDIFPVAPGSENDVADDQIYNVWVKVIEAKSMDKLLSYQATVVMMNNFVDSERSKSIQPKIESYCEENFCLEALTKEFTRVGGRVMCCPLNKGIAELLSLPRVYRMMKVSPINLKIPGITAGGETSASHMSRM